MEKSAKKHRASRLTTDAVSWLNQNNRGASLLATAHQMLQLQQHMSDALPAPLAGACQIIKWQDDTVTLSVPTSAHSAKIRQVIPRLVAALQARGWRIEQIRIRVMAAPDIPAPPPRLRPDQRPELGHRGVVAFTELQEHVRPGPLADAIARLVQRRAT